MDFDFWNVLEALKLYFKYNLQILKGLINMKKFCIYEILIKHFEHKWFEFNMLHQLVLECFINTWCKKYGK